ncbi:MAG TPA: hypothetical protein VMS78_15915 [Rhizomicrobium sp.]|nr:hypothetical protein [Rhizomicrobium sp.]
MYIDRSVRYLNALGNASTSRVLNLMAIAKSNGGEDDYKARPLFQSPVMNAAIVLKHRVRADETYLFLSPRSVATKVIVPFDLKDLRLGGRSFFFEQRGYQEAMQQIGNYREGTMQRDLDVLKLVNAVPSLDPFLLREHLRNHHYEVADCYFSIAQADKARMYEYVSGNIRALIRLAGLGGKESSTAKLVSALLSTEVDEKLAPLRATLGLDGDAFREGVFSWRGFLYYKWCMQNFWPDLKETVHELKAIQPVGVLGAEYLTYLSASKSRIIDAIRKTGVDVSKSLRTYDNAYARLVEHGEPAAFRDFLLSAPAMFLSIGEKMGALSHISSFWRYRFPRGHSGRADAEELVTIFQDFESGFGLQPTPMADWAA